MARYLVTGYPGTGKSAVAHELQRRGRHAYDAEAIRGLMHAESNVTGERIALPSPVPTGWFQQTIDVGAPAMLESKGNKDVFAIKLNAQGNTVWARRFGDRDHDQGRGVGVDGKGNPILAGLFRFTLGDVTPALESVHEMNDKAPKADVFVLRLDR